MAASTLIPLQEYLATSYRPDREYVDGMVLERNVGEKDHSKLQRNFIERLAPLRRDLGITAFPEQRVQVSPTRFRIPDVCVVAGPEPPEQVFTTPPFICIEILSKDDRVRDLQDRIDDYLHFGVTYVWVVDPQQCRAHVYTCDRIYEAKGTLHTENPDITIDLNDLFE